MALSELIAKGAEASIYKINDKILKDRKPKTYRIKELDSQIRYQRTKKEAKITQDARKSGVPTPIILDVEKTKIWFEYIDGIKLKDIFGDLSPKNYQKIGKYVALLHKQGIIHGDLTTSNMLFKNNKIFFIDFGLSGYDERVEPKGVDLHVLFGTIKSTHPSSVDSINEIKKGYRDEAKDSDEILQRTEEIEKRGRYF